MRPVTLANQSKDTSSSTPMDELLQDVPVELEIQLRKTQIKKRRFTPNTSITRQNVKKKRHV